MFLKHIDDVLQITTKELDSVSRLNFAFDKKTEDYSVFVNTEENHFENDYKNVTLSTDLLYDDVRVKISTLVPSISVDSGRYIINFEKKIKFPVEYITEKAYSYWISEAKLSAYILLKSRKLDFVFINLICQNPDTIEKKEFFLSFSENELFSHFSKMLSEYIKWTKLYSAHQDARNKKIKALEFPHEKVRDGQDVIIREVSQALSGKSALYINAPTGIGKTSAVLFSSLKHLAEKKNGRIFYLTSKNSLHDVVKSTCEKMNKTDSAIRVLSLVSKNKLCPRGKCDREQCKLHKNNSMQMGNALLELVTNETYFTVSTILAYSKKYNVCPFELSKNASFFSDVIVCDYNYVFDPYVSKLNLFNYEGGDVLLIDEAHNLVDRVREMYSSRIDKRMLERLAVIYKEINHSFSTLCERFLMKLVKIFENELYTAEPLEKESARGMVNDVNRFFARFQKILIDTDVETEEAEEIFFRFKRFLHLAENVGENSIFYFDEDGNFHLSLIDTGDVIRKVCEKIGNAVFFSGTLAPEEYYRYMLGAERHDTFINLSSPYPQENFKVISYNLSTRFSQRGETLSEVVDVIYTAVSQKTGKYMIFLPSYSYMSSVMKCFSSRHPEICTIAERQSMSARDKSEYISSFSLVKETLVAFAVMGGNFSEGLDLPGEELSGAVIVGLSILPPERSRQLTACYFDDRFLDGTKFAYIYPGMNKVFQAGGRVIRGESDTGFLVVIDDRFLSEEYVENMPDFWRNIVKARDSFSVGKIIKDFFAKKDKKV